jgi:hypothetical protein
MEETSVAKAGDEQLEMASNTKDSPADGPKSGLEFNEEKSLNIVETWSNLKISMKPYLK